MLEFTFNHLHPFLPVDRLVENTHWMAFHHPRPDYLLHILILPKRGLATLLDVPEDQPQLYEDLFKVVKTLVTDYHLEENGYRLVMNGGDHQSISQWHWHLLSEKPGDKHV